RLLLEYCVTRAAHPSAGSQQNANEVAVNFWNRVYQYAAEWNKQYAANSTFAALMPSLRNVSTNQDGLEDRVQLRIGFRLPPGYDITTLRIQLSSGLTKTRHISVFQVKRQHSRQRARRL